MPLSYEDKEVKQLLQQLYRSGFTQAGVDEIYQRLGLGAAPAVPQNLIGQRVLLTRGGRRFSNGSQITGDANSFLNTFARQTQDPYREYGVGNYLGLAGMIVGGAGAAGAFNPATAGAAGGAAGGSAASGAGTLAGSGAPATAGGMVTSSGLGAFAPGSSIGSMATSNAGLLASGGAITGGAGTGTALSRGLNALSGAGSTGGSDMGWNWDTIIDLGGSLLGGWMEADGEKDASRAQTQASREAIAEQRRQFDTTREDLLPWMTAGRGALDRLQSPTTSFEASPDYEFRRDEGMRGIENSFAARGGAASGNALRALTEFNSGNAAGEYGNWWNRQAGLAGIGQTTAQNLGTFGSNNAANIGNLLTNQGNSRASGITGQTNAWTNTLQNLLSSYGRRTG